MMRSPALAEDDETLEIVLTFTREPPRSWTGFRRRIDRMMLADVAWPPSERPHVFVCGPTPLVEAAATALVELGHDPSAVKTERFGPTGGSASHAPDARGGGQGGSDER